MKTFIGLLVVSLALAVTASPFRSRIVGGNDAPAGKYPYQVALWRPGPEFHCGGSIINERYVLTAAHCLYKMQPHEITVRMGTQLLNETGTLYESEKLISHERYKYYLTNNDIALIRLVEKIVYTDKIQPIGLPTENFSDEDYPVILSGWGRLYAEGPQPNSLQEIELKIIEADLCELEWPAVTENQICTLTKKGEGSCYGDSGGPLVVDGVQIGIVSYGYECAVGAPDVFTRVYAYLDWIAEKIDPDHQM